ncbi:LacI family transcriptional regulator [Jatrophihabitans telluris]|uniref:LacI family transcriptional regulator n=1 Tax=Jatrophihabitans telluris TaxID=2038343 RepID=A0ABY4QYU3_9ACTN|nr:LacI family DNA-binding transcriptional regulator [Jatrophihabitans telluris]UQX88457.1 LacI family transcriptional regulator [Jatrophihabitans telluris]
MSRVRLVEVAREAGVHPATASRALNPNARGEVNQRTVQRVMRAAERLGYVPNTLARGLRTSRSFVAALVIPDITNSLFPPIVRGAEQVLSGAGFTLVLTDTNNDLEMERGQVASMRAHGVDGFIVATARWQDPVVDELVSAGIPTVLVNRRCREASLPFVGSDDQRGVRLCVEHLAALGHREIVHLAGPADTSTGRERAVAFRAALREHRIPVRSSVIECAAYSEAAGVEAAQRLLAGGRPFSAIVAANDLLALGAMATLGEAGLRCPQDYSLTGFNDLPFMRKLTPALTTVAVPLTEMGAAAARTLLEWIATSGEAARPAQSLLPVELVVRATTGPAPA